MFIGERYWCGVIVFWAGLPLAILLLPLDVLVTLGYLIAKREAGSGAFSVLFPMPAPRVPTDEEQFFAFCERVNKLPLSDDDKTAMIETAKMQLVEKMMRS